MDERGPPALDLRVAVELLEGPQLRELAVADRPPRPSKLLRSAPLDRLGRQAASQDLDELVRVAGSERAPEAELAATLLQRRLEGVQPGDDVDADREVERVGVRGERLVKPASRQVEHVPRPKHEVLNGLTGAAHLRRVLLVLQRELERGLVDEPALPAGDLQHEDVVGVVVDR